MEIGRNYFQVAQWVSKGTGFNEKPALFQQAILLPMKVQAKYVDGLVLKMFLLEKPQR